MEKQYKAVFFDLGGTLRIAFLEEAYMRHARRKMAEIAGTDMPYEEFYQMIEERYEPYRKWALGEFKESGDEELWCKWLLPDFDPAHIRPICHELSYQYRQSKGYRVIVDGGLEVLHTLHDWGYKLGIISNIISTTFVPRLLEDYGIAEKMSCVILSSVAGIRKPDPEIFRLGAKGCGVTCAEMAYVGDTLSRDVLGRNAKVGLCIQIRNPSIAHRDTAFQNTGLAPDVQIDDLAEIPELIRSKNSSQP